MLVPTLNTLPRHYLAAGLVAAVLAFSACASTPMPPTVALSDANRAIQTAESDDASRYARAELDRARQSLMKADKAVVAQDMILAKRLADEATVTAQLASARSEATKAEAINEEMRRGTEAMLEEIRRAGAKQ